MVQFKVGYYLFAILFLMFDVETVFLFPWAAVCRSLVMHGGKEHCNGSEYKKHEA